MAFTRAKWIWTEDNTRKNDWVWFARDLVLTRPPKRAVLHIAVETKYNLFLNNKLVVLDGGLNRQSNRADGYFDEVDVAKHLRVGKVMDFAIEEIEASARIGDRWR